MVDQYSSKMNYKRRMKGMYDGDLGERSWRDIEIGGYSGGLLTTRYPENLLHEGRTFRYWHYRELALDESKSYIFKTSVTWVHLFWHVAGIYDCEILTFGLAEVSDYGDMLGSPPITNGNHNVSTTTTVEIYPNATITNDGVPFSTWRWYMPEKAEAILAPNINYHLKYVNKHTPVGSGNPTNYVNLTGAWYEREPRMSLPE